VAGGPERTARFSFVLRVIQIGFPVV
jgi:hypothetical protein